MKSPYNFFPILILLLFISCTNENEAVIKKIDTSSSTKVQSEKIQVLNFGTFHMGFTTDATTTKFNEHDKENQRAVHEIAKKLVDFKPTVIVVETLPKNNAFYQEQYEAYCKDPTMFFKDPTELELLAYELGRLAGTEKIYGIDHKIYYDYRVGENIDNQIDSITYNAYKNNPFYHTPELQVNRDSLDLLGNLLLRNHDQYLDFLITINADILTHAGTEGAFEGADEAAKYYQRNLRMYSNLNRLPLTSEDRVFILMGASHTAFFRDFMSRSPKYEMVNTFDYLK